MQPKLNALAMRAIALFLVGCLCLLVETLLFQALGWRLLGVFLRLLFFLSHDFPLKNQLGPYKNCNFLFANRWTRH